VVENHAHLGGLFQRALEDFFVVVSIDDAHAELAEVLMALRTACAMAVLLNICRCHQRSHGQ
jgi:hypothetical protein